MWYLDNSKTIESFLDEYDIHVCKKNEINTVLSFIDDYWCRGHVLVKKRELLDWQHYNSITGEYNFVIAIDRRTEELHAIMGFLLNRHFDPDIRNVIVSPCIWKKRADIKKKGLGSALYSYLIPRVNAETVFSTGVSEIGMKIYRKQGFTTGVMKHYYISNKDLGDGLSKNRESSAVPIRDETDWKINKIELHDYQSLDDNDALFSSQKTYKSKKYYINRYYKHPIYEYDFLGAYEGSELKGILVVRSCEKRGIGKALRIVDYIGNDAFISNLYLGLTEVIREYGYEYLDFLEVGVNDDILNAAGFVERHENNNTIIPHYFEPFIKENVNVNYAYKTESEIEMKILKGDGDLDRPN